MLKGREGKPFNAKQELGWLKEWLGRVRSEVDAGLSRVDTILEFLNQDGPGQEDGPRRNLKLKRKNRNKKKKASNQIRVVGSGSGPIVVKALLKPKSKMSAEAGSSAGLGKLNGPIKSPGASGGFKVQKKGALAGMG